jgi:acid stress chaperone HdeA
VARNPFSVLTVCRTTQRQSFKPKVVYLAAAYGKGGMPEAAVIDVEGTETVIPAIIEERKKAPKESFWQKVTAEFKKIEKK